MPWCRHLCQYPSDIGVSRWSRRRTPCVRSPAPLSARGHTGTALGPGCRGRLSTPAFTGGG
eukprot:2017571-Rhodomonas_salina.1